MNRDLSPTLRDLYARIDEQIERYRLKPSPGDRRRTKGNPPEGMAERRTNQERRGRARNQ